MEKEKRRCPNCGEHFELPHLYIPLSFPVATGDVESIEASARLKCPLCKAKLEVRVLQSFSGEVLEVYELELVD